MNPPVVMFAHMCMFAKHTVERVRISTECLLNCSFSVLH